MTFDPTEKSAGTFRHVSNVLCRHRMTQELRGRHRLTQCDRSSGRRRSIACRRRNREQGPRKDGRPPPSRLAARQDLKICEVIRRLGVAGQGLRRRRRLTPVLARGLSGLSGDNLWNAVAPYSHVAKGLDPAPFWQGRGKGISTWRWRHTASIEAQPLPILPFTADSSSAKAVREILYGNIGCFM